MYNNHCSGVDYAGLYELYYVVSYGIHGLEKREDSIQK